MAKIINSAVGEAQGGERGTGANADVVREIEIDRWWWYLVMGGIGEGVVWIQFKM